MKKSSPPAKSLSGAAGQLLLLVCGPAADSIGKDIELLYKNWAWRRSNIENIAELHLDEVERRRLNAKNLRPLPEGDAYRTMEAASLEDDESVQKLWAGLITSAMDPDSSVKSSKVFVSILRSIDAAEVSLLNILYKIDKPIKSPGTIEALNEEINRLRSEINQDAEKSWRRYDSETRQTAIQNLMRLRCVGFRTGKRLKESDLLRHIPIMAPRHSVKASAEGFAKAVDYLENLALAASGTGEVPLPPNLNGDFLPEARYQLTSLGSSLMRACLT